MTKYNNTMLAAAFMMTLSTSSMAVDLGEVNGVKFAVSGYIKAEGVFNNPDVGENVFDGTVRQSRLNFKATRDINGHTVTAFVEGDFWGDFPSNASFNWRLRHAFVTVDKFTVGQTWNGQFWATAPLDGEMMNFWGLGTGTIAGNGARVRPDLVLHYADKGFRLSAQNPIYSESSTPDLVGSYTKRTPGGSGISVAITGREVENGSDSDYGLGVSVAGKLMLGKNDIRLSAFTGKGMGVYSGVGVGGAWKGNDSTIDIENGELVSQTGFAAAYKQQFSPKIRGTVRYGEVKVDDTADTKLELVTVNMIYTYLPGLDLGVEWRDQNIDTLNFGPFTNVRPAGQQVEFMVMYKF